MQSRAARAGVFTLAAVVLTAGCTSASVGTHSSPGPADPVRGGSTHLSTTQGSAGVTVPATAYLSVIQAYFPYATPTRSAAAKIPQRLHFAVTDRQTIARLAAMINALPRSADKLPSSCPEALGPAFELDFGDGPGKAPRAQVSILCFGVMVSLGAHDEPILSDTGSPGADRFLNTIASLLSDQK
ncbi:hypothetical protein KDL01_24140 [Actinospica durhamensis]|uniref:Lipoprotein n=1 Tax=Actinospica durhamensis TaxID=1508375 RepID=A0A941EQ22_9ACTN|nr:hypothetical protein [Actinospica durhamensis]MBR7836390.1 hypothetical protein [Actinospica durhamensis]